MTRSLRRAIAAASLLALTSTTTGCFGSFILVKKVYGFNQSLSNNKFVQTLIFWVFCFLPVYEFAALADAIVLNLIEFWTGSNPLAMRDGETQQRVVEADGQKATLTFADHGRSVRIEIATAGQPNRVFQFRGDDTTAELRDGEGRVLTSTTRAEDGSVDVLDGAGQRLAHADASELELEGHQVGQQIVDVLRRQSLEMSVGASALALEDGAQSEGLLGNH